MYLEVGSPIMSQEIPMDAVHAPKNRLLLHFSVRGPPPRQDSVLDVISYLDEIDLSHLFYTACEELGKSL